MKKEYKLLNVLLATTLCFGAFSACGTSKTLGVQKGSLKINIEEKGFGTQWLQDIANSFTNETGIKTNVEIIYTNEIPTLLNAGQANFDVGITANSVANAARDNLLIDLRDVLGLTKDGSEGAQDAIYRKMNPNTLEDLQTKDKNNDVYILPYADSVTSFIYNETMLNETLGVGNWKVPNTTKEMIALADEIVDAGQYAFTCATSVGYWTYIFPTLWAQYTGLTQYKGYFDGYYYDENGVAKFSDNGELYTKDTGRLEALKFFEEALCKSNGYMHKDADVMSFNDAQKTLLGMGYGNNKKTVAFMVCGDWFENEMGSALQMMEDANKPQTIKMMKTPIISSIVDRLTDKTMSDETLSAVITAVDNGETSFPGVIEEDFNIIKEARNYVYSSSKEQAMVVPKNSPNLDLAKQFLAYVLSDYGQSVYSKYLNGLTMPYGYQVDATKLSVFTKTRYELFADYQPIRSGYGTKMETAGLGKIAFPSGFPDGTFFSGKWTAQEVYDNSNEEYLDKWGDVLRKAGLKS